MNAIRSGIQDQVRLLVGQGGGLDLESGDSGLFGPESVAWDVHADFTSMMIGGVSALFLQMLHPGALAGVWDHSDFLHDMRGRLQRTAQFVAGTTYGSTAEAERLISRVRAIHGHVVGRLPDGTPYSANDPALLTWVHVSEVSSFLAAYLRYRNASLPRVAQDRYFAETAVVALRLGAVEVPTSVAAVAAYMRAMRPRLRHDVRTAATASALLAQPAPSLLATPFRSVTMQAGIELLPDWAAKMHGFKASRARRQLIRAGAGGIGVVLRWALTEGSARRARRRASAIA